VRLPSITTWSRHPTPGSLYAFLDHCYSLPWDTSLAVRGSNTLRDPDLGAQLGLPDLALGFRHSYKPLDHPSWNLAAQPCGASLPDYVEPFWQSLGTARQTLHWTNKGTGARVSVLAGRQAWKSRVDLILYCISWREWGVRDPLLFFCDFPVDESFGVGK